MDAGYSFLVEVVQLFWGYLLLVHLVADVDVASEFIALFF